jgi:hypothetical protein
VGLRHPNTHTVLLRVARVLATTVQEVRHGGEDDK